MSTNVRLEVSIEAIPMIPITHIDRLIWNERLGKRLETLRGSVSRREMCERLEVAGFHITISGLAKIERGGVDSIDARMIVSILAILGMGLETMYPTFSADKKLVSTLETLSA
ncbi:helix-turn-helix domain-containing protein [Nostoc sp. CENA67]|uniref:Helix-turn-helix domain-containing protein n=1 Tax=Amazonocrinis nigriterrae CENA67 TaxID=2794033 RepID=A0A8J7LEF9_9NOST|nr:helix-turn-helix domain-containing protein [Amazonocrinis nigriterrae]MBH8566691.1 helix-turn-helix domain-containing protein [Amazonocrinis nigriterrae CENA67]